MKRYNKALQSLLTLTPPFPQKLVSRRLSEFSDLHKDTESILDELCWFFNVQINKISRLDSDGDSGHSYHLGLVEAFKKSYWKRKNPLDDILGSVAIHRVLVTWKDWRNKHVHGELTGNPWQDDIRKILIKLPSLLIKLREAVEFAEEIVVEPAQVLLGILGKDPTDEIFNKPVLNGEEKALGDSDGNRSEVFGVDTRP